jgi:hypothetical protein
MLGQDVLRVLSNLDEVGDIVAQAPKALAMLSTHFEELAGRRQVIEAAGLADGADDNRGRKAGLVVLPNLGIAVHAVQDAAAPGICAACGQVERGQRLGLDKIGEKGRRAFTERLRDQPLHQRRLT